MTIMPSGEVGKVEGDARIVPDVPYQAVGIKMLSTAIGDAHLVLRSWSTKYPYFCIVRNVCNIRHENSTNLTFWCRDLTGTWFNGYVGRTSLGYVTQFIKQDEQQAEVSNATLEETTVPIRFSQVSKVVDKLRRRRS